MARLDCYVSEPSRNSSQGLVGGGVPRGGNPAGGVPPRGGNPAGGVPMIGGKPDGGVPRKGGAPTGGVLGKPPGATGVRLGGGERGPPAWSSRASIMALRLTASPACWVLARSWSRIACLSTSRPTPCSRAIALRLLPFCTSVWSSESLILRDLAAMLRSITGPISPWFAAELVAVLPLLFASEFPPQATVASSTTSSRTGVIACLNWTSSFWLVSSETSLLLSLLRRPGVATSTSSRQMMQRCVYSQRCRELIRKQASAPSSPSVAQASR